MSALPAVPRTPRSSSRGRRQVRLAADDLAEIVELALRAPGPTARAALAQIAGHDGEGASEVIADILERTSPRPAARPARAQPAHTTVERAVPAPRAALDERESRRLLALTDRVAAGGTVVLHGPSGAGKTLRARWIAHHRARAVTTIDLAATGAVALPRLVDAVAGATASGMSVHLENASERGPEVLDTLVRARLGSALMLVETTEPPAGFPVDAVIEVGLPDVSAISALLRDALGDGDERALRTAAALLHGETPRAVQLSVESARRFAAMTEISVVDALQAAAVQRLVSWPPRRRRDVAIALMQSAGLSQRAVQELTGVSRDTLRRYAPPAGG